LLTFWRNEFWLTTKPGRQGGPSGAFTAAQATSWLREAGHASDEEGAHTMLHRMQELQFVREVTAESDRWVSGHRAGTHVRQIWYCAIDFLSAPGECHPCCWGVEEVGSRDVWNALNADQRGRCLGSGTVLATEFLGNFGKFWVIYSRSGHFLCKF